MERLIKASQLFLTLTGASVLVFGIVITALCAFLAVNKFLKMKAQELYKI